MNNQYKGLTLELKTKFSNTEFEDADFSDTNFNSAIFDNVRFKNSRFFKSKLNGSKIFGTSEFELCHFLQVDLSNSTFGSNQGVYKDCTFEKCNFKGKEFTFSEFINCTFLNSKLQRINFNGSKFTECKFIGKLEDVSFNGIYDTNPSPHSCLNLVDFSEATFSEFVTFYHCDLSTCIPPNGLTFSTLLYQIYKSNPAVQSTGSKDKIILD